MNQQRSGCLGIALVVCVILLGFSAMLNLVFFGANTKMGAGAEIPKFEETMVVPSGERDPDKVALIYVRGLISSLEPGSLGETAIDDLKLQLKQAADDNKVKAIVLFVDSPGGEVTASDTLYNAVRRFRDERKKPVVVYMSSLAASGGYYVACGGNHLIANDTTLTGSIGVIMQTFKYKQLFEKVGLEMVVFKSGAFKDMLSGARDLTEPEKEYIQHMITQSYDKFVGIVARERKLPEEGLRSGVADGRVVSGKDALAEKLVDQLGDVEVAYAKAMELGKAPTAAVIRYESPFKLARLFRLLGGAQAQQNPKVQVELSANFTPKLEAGKAYYLPSFLAP
jgi:protease IV